MPDPLETHKGRHYVTQLGNFPCAGHCQDSFFPWPSRYKQPVLGSAGQACFLGPRFSTLLVSVAGILSSACLTRQESIQPPRLPPSRLQTSPPRKLARGDGKDIRISRSDGSSLRGAAALLTHQDSLIAVRGRTLNTGFSDSWLYLHGTQLRAAPVMLTKHSEESLSGD